MMETPPGLSRLTRKVVAQRVQRTLGGTRVLVEDLKHRYKNRKRLNWLLTQPAGGLSISPVIHPLSEEARKAATGAMSCGWPMTPERRLRNHLLLESRCQASPECESLQSRLHRD